jgi:hypothetical protein
LNKTGKEIKKDLKNFCGAAKTSVYMRRASLSHTKSRIRCSIDGRGAFKFFYLYLKGFFGALRQKENWNFQARRQACLEIPHEVEARSLAAKYVSRRERRKTYFSSSINSK